MHVELPPRSAEGPDVRELIEVGEPDLQRLPGAHRQARDGPVVATRARAVLGVHGRNQVRERGLLERVPRLRSDLGGVPLIHHHQHRLRLPGREQVVEDEVHPALVALPALVFSDPVLEVQHRISLRGFLVLTGRAVDERPSGRAGDLRVVPECANLAVRHVLHVVEVGSLLRDLDPAGLLPPAEERLAAGIVDGDPAHDQPVVVEPRHDRRSGHGPDPVLAPDHVERTFPEPVVSPAGLHLNFLGAGGFEPERDAEVGVDAGYSAPRTLDDAGRNSS